MLVAVSSFRSAPLAFSFVMSSTWSKIAEVSLYQAMAPFSGALYDLKAGKFLECPDGVKMQQKTKKSQISGAYQRLLAAGQRLLTVIRHNEGGANKDLAKFTSQILNLCDKWDR